MPRAFDDDRACLPSSPDVSFPGVAGACRAELGLTSTFTSSYPIEIDPLPTPTKPVQTDATVEPSGSGDSDSASSTVPDVAVPTDFRDAARVVKGNNAFTRLRYVAYKDGSYRGENHVEFYASADAMKDDATPPVAVLAPGLGRAHPPESG